MEELHLIIIWSKAIYQKEKIINDISNDFKIINVYNVKWTDKNFSNNLSRFYGENLPKNSHKEKHCGKDTFCCVIVKDLNPRYETRLTSKGSKIVNINLFDKKQLYRSWTGGGHKIHATDNIQETKYQLALLFGICYDSLIRNDNKFVDEKIYNSDLIGSEGWNNFEELFKILNYTCDYVVLRNFNNLEKQLHSEHPDIDIMVYNKEFVVNMLNAKKTSSNSHRVQYSVLVEDKNINFDIRYVGDNYYDKFWQIDILENKVMHKKGFFVPNNMHHFYSLVYHALIHKRNVSDDYNDQFINLAQKININLAYKQLVDFKLFKRLFIFMATNRYSFVEPVDLTVFYNVRLIKNYSINKISQKRDRLYFKQSILGKLKKVLIEAFFRIIRVLKKLK